MIDYPLKILLIEDTLSDVALITRQIKKVIKNPNIHHVTKFKEYTVALNFLRPDIIISDYILVDYSGLDVLDHAQQHSPKIPFIFVTSSMDDYNLAENTILNKVTLFVLKFDINQLHKSLLPIVENIIGLPKKSNYTLEQRMVNETMNESIQKMTEENKQHIKNYTKINKDLKDSTEKSN